MKRILITGATGNIGAEVIHFLYQSDSDDDVIAAIRDKDKAAITFKDYPNLSQRIFDFEDENTFSEALADVDILFLLRPPHISQVEKYFEPLLHSAQAAKIDKVVFLSVQGAEKSKVIPHNKIERLLKKFGFKYIFVRPSYFMQNLTTTLLREITESKSITLPSGSAKFNWVDAQNVGEAVAQLLRHFDKYQDNAFDITGPENKNFHEIADLVSEITGVRITYTSINPVSFYLRKKKEAMASGFAAVMTMLHFLPRIQRQPQITNNFTAITGHEPTSVRSFIKREKHKFPRP